MNNSNYGCNEIIKICQKKAITELKPSKHIKVKIFYNNKIVAQTEIPHGRRTLGKGLYKEIAKQLLLSVDEFDLFLECNFSREMYQDRLKLKSSSG